MPNIFRSRSGCPHGSLTVWLYEVVVLTLFVLVSMLPQKASATVDAAMRSYVGKYRSIAEKKSVEYAIPVEIILAIAIVESGSGKTRVARELNNHFGMIGRNHARWKTRYKQYPNAEASYDHFCRYLSKQRFYRRLSKSADERLWIRAISRLGYSERPKIWEKRLSRVIGDIKGL